MTELYNGSRSRHYSPLVRSTKGSIRLGQALGFCCVPEIGLRTGLLLIQTLKTRHVRRQKCCGSTSSCTGDGSGLLSNVLWGRKDDRSSGNSWKGKLAQLSWPAHATYVTATLKTPVISGFFQRPHNECGLCARSICCQADSAVSIPLPTVTWSSD